MDFKEFMSSKFNPTLSWDGVAMIGACVGCCIWFGSMSETIRQHGEMLKEHQKTINTMNQNQQLISQNIAVLQTIVNERLRTGTK